MWHFVTSKQQKCLNQQRNNHETPTIWPYQENDHEIIGYYIRDTSLIFYGAEFNVASVFFLSIVGVFAGFVTYFSCLFELGSCYVAELMKKEGSDILRTKLSCLVLFVIYISSPSLVQPAPSCVLVSVIDVCWFLISVELILAIVNFCYWCVLTFNFSGTDPSNFEFLLRNLLHLCRKL